MSGILLEFEKAVLDRFAMIDARLRKQVEAATVADRHITGVGFFTNLRVEDSALAIEDRATFRLTDVRATARGAKHGMDFVLLVTNGFIAQLEGFTYDEPWPDDLIDFEIV